MASIPYALQLYTIREFLARDLEGTLAQVGALGYSCVELAGTHGHDADAFKKLLDGAGLTPVSAHIPFPEIVDTPARAIAEARALGIDYLVVPWLGGEEFATLAAWEEAGERLDVAGAALRAAGIRLCYHNHAHEFIEVDGAQPYHALLAKAAPENLAIQLDTCWAEVAGGNVVELLDRYAGRVPLLHLKDYAAGDPPTLTELGRGCMDWDAILDAARRAGVVWNIVEQDGHFAVDALDSARAGALFMAGRQA